MTKSIKEILETEPPFVAVEWVQDGSLKRLQKQPDRDITELAWYYALSPELPLEERVQKLEELHQQYISVRPNYDEYGYPLPEGINYCSYLNNG